MKVNLGKVGSSSFGKTTNMEVAGFLRWIDPPFGVVPAPVNKRNQSAINKSMACLACNINETTRHPCWFVLSKSGCPLYHFFFFFLSFSIFWLPLICFFGSSCDACIWFLPNRSHNVWWCSYVGFGTVWLLMLDDKHNMPLAGWETVPLDMRLIVFINTAFYGNVTKTHNLIVTLSNTFLITI